MRKLPVWCLLVFGVVGLSTTGLRADESAGIKVQRAQKSAVGVKRAAPEKEHVLQSNRSRPSEAEIGLLEKRIQQGRALEARRWLRQLIRRYPSWHPPGEMLDRLTRLEGERRIWSLIQKGQVQDAYVSIEELRRKLPGWRPDQSRINAWRIAEGEKEIWSLLARGRVADAQAVIQRIQQQAPSWQPSKKMMAVMKIAGTEPELWDLLHDGDFRAIDARLQELRKIAPDWQPSPAFQRELKKARLDETLERAWRERDWNAIVSLYHQAPELFDCSGQHRRLKLAEAYLGLGEEERAFQAYAAGFDHCKEHLNLEALEHAASRLPAPRLGELVALIRQRPLSFEGRRRVAAVELRYLTSSGLDSHEVAKRVKAIEQSLLERPDPALARTLGWIYLEAGMHEDALRMFHRSLDLRDSVDARKGEILALHALHRWSEVRKRIRKSGPMLSRGGVMPDMLPLLVDACGHLGDDACVIRSLGRLAKSRKLTTDEAMALGWAQYRTGKAGDAAVTFEQSYRAQPSAEAAEGLRLSLLAAGEPFRLAELAMELDGPLAAAQEREAAQRLFDSGLYHTALAAGSQAPALLGADSNRVTAGWSYRRVSANLLTPALDQLALATWTLIGDWFVRPDRWLEVRMDRIRLDAGPPLLLPADHVGTAVIAPARIYPVKTRWTGYEWDIAFHRQGWTSWEVRLGQGFRGGPLAPDWKGRLLVRRQFNLGWAEIEAYRRPVRSTMLSYIGLQAPQAPIVWGRVSRSGAGLKAYLDTGIPRLGIYADFGIESLNGVQVASNRQWHASVSLPVHLWQAAWRADLAPMVTWMRYRHDRNHFTVGHGGYFSPQHYRLAGLFAELARENPGDRFHVRLTGLWGRQSYNQEAAVRLPLAPNPILPPFLPQQVHSMVLDAQVEFGLRLGRHWKLAGILRTNRSEHFVLGIRQFYRNSEALLSLTWNRDELGGLLTDDPPALGLDHLE